LKNSSRRRRDRSSSETSENKESDNETLENKGKSRMLLNELDYSTTSSTQTNQNQELLQVEIEGVKLLPFTIEDEVELKRYRREDLLELQKMVQDVAEMFKDVRVMLQAQQEDLNQVEQNVNVAKVSVIKGEQELIQASKLHSRFTKVATIAAGGLLGFVVGGPVGAIYGAKTAAVGLSASVAVGGLGGAMLGALTAGAVSKKLLKKKESLAAGSESSSNSSNVNGSSNENSNSTSSSSKSNSSDGSSSDSNPKNDKNKIQ